MKWDVVDVGLGVAKMNLDGIAAFFIKAAELLAQSVKQVRTP